MRVGTPHPPPHVHRQMKFLVVAVVVALVLVTVECLWRGGESKSENGCVSEDEPQGGV